MNNAVDSELLQILSAILDALADLTPEPKKSKLKEWREKIPYE